VPVRRHRSIVGNRSRARRAVLADLGDAAILCSGDRGAAGTPRAGHRPRRLAGYHHTGAWDRVLARVAARIVTKMRAARTYLLSGMLRCGRWATGCSPKPVTTTPDHRVRRYFCLKGADQGGCGRLTEVAEPVEQLVTDAVLVRPDSRYLADAMAARTSLDHDIADLASQLDADQGRLDVLAGRYADPKAGASMPCLDASCRNGRGSCCPVGGLPRG
jgi:hypothetical protein